MSEYTQRDYEAIEAAVLESPRGRWFLNEYARRNRAADTITLLGAIRKLERGVTEPSPHHVSHALAAELHSLSEALGSTLAGMGEAAEGGPAGQVCAAIEQLSQVKRQVDALLAEPSLSSADQGGGALTAENLSYFAGDEELFEPSAQTADNVPTPAPSLVVVGDEQGDARPAAPEGEPKDRIVFIRRASSEETSIPLADEADDAAPAARPQPVS